MMVKQPVRPAMQGAQMGLFAGLACLAYFLILYFIKPDLLLSPWLLFSFIIIVFFKVLNAYLLWKAEQGNIHFKVTLQSVFMVSVVSLLILVVFYYLMFNFVDSSLLKQVKEKITENAMKSFDENRITKIQLEEAIAKIEGIKLSVGASSIIYSAFLFVGFFYALVFAGISRLISKDISFPPSAAS